MVTILFETLFIVIRIIELAALVSIIMSWIMPFSKFRMTIEWLLSPLMAPFRKLNMLLMSRFRLPLDFSYLFFLIGIDIARELLSQLYMRIIML